MYEAHHIIAGHVAETDRAAVCLPNYGTAGLVAARHSAHFLVGFAPRPPRPDYVPELVVEGPEKLPQPRHAFRIRRRQMKRILVHPLFDASHGNVRQSDELVDPAQGAV